jgi:hypothetical protein
MDGPSGLVIGGETRGSCDDGGKGALVRITPQFVATQIWKDDDPFPSTVQSMVSAKDIIFFAVKRQRPIGVRRVDAALSSAGSKRWGDTGDELLEFSLLQIQGDGMPTPWYDSSFGLSAYAQGLLLDGNSKPVLYGSLGGRPAISIQQ